MSTGNPGILLWAGGVLLLAGVGIGVPIYRAVHFELASFHPLKRKLPSPPADTEQVSWEAQGNSISGWYAPGRNRAAVILLHGSGADREQLLPEFRLLSSAGFGVLALDLPGHGESSGEVRMGSPELAALRGAVDWLSHRPELDAGRVGVLGNSLGAGLAVVGAARDPRIAALAATGAFTDTAEQTRYEYRNAWPWARWAAQAVGAFHIEGGKLRPLDFAAFLKKRPTLFIAGEEDPSVPPQMSKALAAATGGELWLIPHCGHHGYGEAAPQSYPQRLRQFFEGALLWPSPVRAPDASTSPFLRTGLFGEQNTH